MKSIVAVLSLLAIASAGSEIDTLLVSPLETDGVLQCIADRDVKLSINNVTTFCGPEVTNNQDCYRSFYALRLCLINNKCQNRFEE